MSPSAFCSRTDFPAQALQESADRGDSKQQRSTGNGQPGGKKDASKSGSKAPETATARASTSTASGTGKKTPRRSRKRSSHSKSADAAAVTSGSSEDSESGSDSESTSGSGSPSASESVGSGSGSDADFVTPTRRRTGTDTRTGSRRRTTRSKKKKAKATQDSAEVELDPLAVPLTLALSAPSPSQGHSNADAADSEGQLQVVDPAIVAMLQAFMAQHPDPKAAMMAALAGATIPPSGPACGVSPPTESESGFGGNCHTPAGTSRGRRGSSSKPPSDSAAQSPAVDPDSARPSRELAPTRHRDKAVDTGATGGAKVKGPGLGSVGFAFGAPGPVRALPVSSASRRASELQQVSSGSDQVGKLVPAHPPYLQPGVPVVVMGGATTADWLVTQQERLREAKAKQAAKAKREEENRIYDANRVLIREWRSRILAWEGGKRDSPLELPDFPYHLSQFLQTDKTKFAGNGQPPSTEPASDSGGRRASSRNHA